MRFAPPPVVALISFVCFSALFAHLPIHAQNVREAPQVKPGKSGLAGRVVDTSTGAPLQGVIVTLSEAAPSSGQLTGQTDREGRFTFRNVAAATYQLSAEGRGYLAWGSKTAIILLEGYVDNSLVIRLAKQGIVAGAVLDEGQAPLRNATVVALKWQAVSGDNKVAIQSVTTTDLEGRFRLTGLSEGDYVIWLPSMQVTVPRTTANARESVRPPAAVTPFFVPRVETNNLSGIFNLWTFGIGAPIRLNDGRAKLFQSLFWPDAATPAQAIRIRVAAGEERPNIDFAPRRLPAFIVSGRLEAVGQVISHVPVYLSSNVADDFAIAGDYSVAVAVTDNQGRFVFPGVPTGEYQVTVLTESRPDLGKVIPPGWLARRRNLPNGGFEVLMVAPNGEEVPLPASVGPTSWSRVPLSVQSTDVSNLTVPLRPGIQLSGLVTCDAPNTGVVLFENLRVNFEALDGPARGRASAGQGIIDFRGRMEASSLTPGSYYVRISGLPVGWFVKTIRLGRDDSLELPIALDGNRSDLSIVLTQSQSRLQGSVFARRGGSADIVVFVFPSDRALWHGYGRASGRLLAVGVDAAGNYSITGLPAGSYFVTAARRENLDDWRTQEILASLSAGARLVSIKTLETVTTNLEVSEPDVSVSRATQRWRVNLKWIAPILQRLP